MPNEPLLALLELLAQGSDDDRSLCTAAATFTNLSGAGIVLSSPGPHVTSFCASNDVAQSLQDIEYALGEGPGIDASRTNVALEEPDLWSNRTGQWIAYAPAAREAGARAVFGFPLSIGANRIGALVLYRDRPGSLSERQESDAYLVALVVGRAILATRAGAPRRELPEELGLALSFDFSVHQAAGMLAVQARSHLDDAYLLLRAHSIGSGLSMTDLSQGIVQREIFYDYSTREWSANGVTDQ